MVRKSLLFVLIAGALLWPSNAARTITPGAQGFQAAIREKGQAQGVMASTLASGSDGQLFPHFNPYGPGHFEGPFPRDHKHHKHRSSEYGFRQ